MLDLLIHYAKTHGLTIEPGFKSKNVEWAIVFDEQGTYLNVQSLGTEDTGRQFEFAPHLEQPEIKVKTEEADESRRHFLVDDLEVVARYDGPKSPSPSEKPKVINKHKFFIGLLKIASSELPILEAIAAGMESDSTIAKITLALSEKKAKKTQKATFAVMRGDIFFPVDDKSWHQWWREYRRKLVKLSDQKAICYATGNLILPSMTHPVVSGLRKYGGHSSGDRLASYKQKSFRSYNLDQSENIAISDQEAWAYRAAFEDLIERKSQNLAGACVVHWYAGESEVRKNEDPMGLLDNSFDLSWIDEFSDDDSKERDALHLAQEFLECLKSGTNPRLCKLADYRYYAMILSGNSGRVVVREWIYGQFEDLLESIVDWFDSLAITRIDGERLAKSPKIERVITSLLPPRKPSQKYEKWIKPIGAERSQLWHAAISNTVPVPHKVVSKIIPLHSAFILSGGFDEAMDEKSKNRAQYLSLLYTRMGLLKAYHRRKGDKNMKPYLNEEHPNPAYHCGRLMAVYADLQSAAMPNVGAGVVQRYYAAASATPALIFGRLARGAQFHLNKLEGGLAHWYEQRLACIWARLQQDPPATLTLEEQSLFAMGYYQQKAHDMPKQTDESKTNDSKENDNV